MRISIQSAGVALIVIATSFSVTNPSWAQSGSGRAASPAPTHSSTDELLSSPDRAVREKQLQRFLSAPDRTPPLMYISVVQTLLLSGRTDEARKWFYRGHIRLLVDMEFSRTEFGAEGLGDIVAIYDTGGAVGVPQSLGGVLRPESEDALDRLMDDALIWDAATPRNYPMDWMLAHSMEAYAGAKKGSLKPGWETRLASAREAVRVAFIQAEKKKREAAQAEEARGSAARAGIAAQEATTPSSDPLDSSFANTAKPVRTIDLHGCVALPGQPMDDQGNTLLVRCPDFEKVDLTTGAVLWRVLLSSSPQSPDCPVSTFLTWPPSYMEITPPPLNVDFAADSRSNSIFMACARGIWNIPLQGDLSALRLPILTSINGGPLARLEIDATGTHIDPSKVTIITMMPSADGRYLLLTASFGQSTSGLLPGWSPFGLLIDIPTRKARSFRPEDLPAKGMSVPYSGFGQGVLIADPLAVVVEVNRPIPGARAWEHANTVVVWPLDGSPPKGIDTDEWTEPSKAGPPSNLILDRGPISLKVAACGGGRCTASKMTAPTNAAAGFREVHFDLTSGAMHWFDPRDMWIGDEAAARSRYGAGSGPIHCEAQPSGRVVLGHRWATEPFAARVFPHSGPVWCAMNDQAKRLVVGVGRYAHVYALQ